MHGRGWFGGLLAVLALGSSAGGAPSSVETLPGGVVMVRDDGGFWDGNQSLSITHQNRASYQARKILDLSAVPEEAWAGAREIRVSAFLAVRDYSGHLQPAANGLDEAIEVVVNGSVNTFPTSGGAPVYREGVAPGLDWYGFPVPREQFRRGPNEIVLRKAPADKNDDYLYLGIDHTRELGRSAVDFGDGGGWRQDTLTVPGGRGEYMVRVFLVTGDLTVEASWVPGLKARVEDPARLLLFQGSREGRPEVSGLSLGPGQSAQVEWETKRLDPAAGLAVAVEGTGRFALRWIGADGSRVAPVTREAPFTLEQDAGAGPRAAGVLLAAEEGPATLVRVAVRGRLACRPPEPLPPDQRPDMAPPAGAAVQRPPGCEIAAGEARLENSGLRARFAVTDGRLRLVSLYNEWGAAEMVRRPEAVDLFLVECEGQRCAGSRDFALDELAAEGNGFRAVLTQAALGLRARLGAAIDEEGLRLTLDLENAGGAPREFKVAFPHLAGLALSEPAAGDYYFFPWSGLFSNELALIRRGYGDHEALYQILDLFSPARGAGLYLRLDDAEGWHKVLALRKQVPGEPCRPADASHVRTRPEYTWSRSLPEVEGIGMACEYLRRTRAPGKSFSPAPAVLAAHPGDWRVALRAYAEWARRVWTWRPYPSRLTGVHTMTAHGWGQDVLFRDGAYRTDFIKPMADCVEIMSWWEWSERGPLGAPLDQLESALTPAQARLWKPYVVKDPVTGRLMWNNQPGDYRGYNERFGGLPAFRQAVAAWKAMGPLVTLYTDPFRLDEFSCETGRRYGKAWCVLGPDGKYTMAYEVTNPCHDLAEVRAWVAAEMRRVMQETGADGIRLDEYGHMGWACFNPDHNHTYAEPGVSQWNKAVAEATAAVRQAMDEVAPGSVLTTEHPGYDYLMRCIEGCITYDYTVLATPLRPLEVNLQRFLFPECKAFELDHRSADPHDRKKFWNGVASFGRLLPRAYYTLYKENGDVYGSRDCEALVPTLVPRVYANRFEGGGKAFYHLYNAAGHTVHGPVLELRPGPGRHVVELLSGAALTPAGERQAVALWLERDDVACIAVLPERLREVRREGQTLSLRVEGDPAGCILVLAAADGAVLASRPAAPGENRLDLAALPGNPAPALAKLLRDGALQDAHPLPP